MSDPWDFPSEEPKPRNKGGRPRGVPNRNPEQKLLIEKIEGLYAAIEHMLTPEQREYYRKAFEGKIEFDPIKDGELFIKLYSVYVINITAGAIRSNTASKEVAENVNQYRQFLKDIEEMNRKREEWKVKTGEHGELVDPTRESSLARFQNFHGGNSGT